MVIQVHNLEQNNKPLFLEWLMAHKFLTSHSRLLNTFTAKADHSQFKYSCLKLPASTLVDLIFQSRSFSLKSAHYRRETFTAASVHLADIIFIPFIVYYFKAPGDLNRWQRLC
jgi:hypothetical protein